MWSKRYNPKATFNLIPACQCTQNFVCINYFLFWPPGGQPSHGQSCAFIVMLWQWRQISAFSCQISDTLMDYYHSLLGQSWFSTILYQHSIILHVASSILKSKYELPRPRVHRRPFAITIIIDYGSKDQFMSDHGKKNRKLCTFDLILPSFDHYLVV